MVFCYHSREYAAYHYRVIVGFDSTAQLGSQGARKKNPTQDNRCSPVWHHAIAC